jgi:hypothetical protein
MISQPSETALWTMANVRWWQLATTSPENVFAIWTTIKAKFIRQERTMLLTNLAEAMPARKL